MTTNRPAHAGRRPGHLSRTRDPAPWSRRGTPPIRNSPPPGRPDTATVPTPVFVDDSGRRRRAGRLLAGGVASLAVGYLAVVGLTFAGAPIVGHLAPPGLDQLARPAGDEGAGVGPGQRESPLPPAAGAGDVTGGTAATAETTPTPGDEAATAPASPAPTATAPATTTTTTAAAPPGQRATTTVPSPSSTVPDRTAPGGPPDHPPGKP